MQLQFSVYVLPVIASAILSAAVAAVAWRRRPASGATALALLMGFVTLWSVGYALRLLSVDLESKLFWAKFRYFGILPVPATWLILAIQYTGYGKRWLRSWAYAALVLEPAVMLVLVWTNEVHHLFWAQIDLASYRPLTLLSTVHGPAFWAHTIYSYILFLAGSLLLGLMLIRSSGLYRRQVLSLLLALLSPLVASVLSIFDLFPIPLDLVPFGFSLAGLALAWGLFRSQLLEVAPVAREAVIDALPLATLVLDIRGQIVDLNPAAERLLGLSILEVAGRPAKQALERYPDLVVRCQQEGEGEVIIGEGREKRVFLARTVVLRDPARTAVGRLVTLEEITERKRAEEAVRGELRRIRTLAGVARIGASTDEISDLLDRTAKLLHDRLGFDHVAFYMMDGRQVHVILTVLAGIEEPDLSPGRRWRLEEAGAVGRAIRSRRLQWLSDIEPEEGREGPHLSGGRSEIAVPLLAGARVLGVLDVQSRTPGAFTESDIVVLQAVADQLAALVERLRQIREAEQATYGLEPTTDLTARTLWESAFLEGGRPVGYRYRGVSVEPIDATYPEAQAACKEGRSVTLTLEGDGRGEVGALAVPIRFRDQVIGVVDLRFEGGTIPADVVALVEAVSDRLALALENARLLEETRRRAARERLRAEVSARIRSSADVDSILRAAVQELSRALRASEGLIRLEVSDRGSGPASGEEEQQ